MANQADEVSWNDCGYVNALRAAGAEVLDYETFGDYQGTWLARVRVGGEVGYIEGSYGSCSGCDAFEAEFGWHDDSCDEHAAWPPREDCAKCQSRRTTYQERLAAFGRGYLEDGLLTPERAIETHEKDSEWDLDADKVVAWVRAQDA